MHDCLAKKGRKKGYISDAIKQMKMTVITVELIDLRVKALLEDLAKMNLIQTWTQEELDAYEYAFMREEDERARLDKAKQDGKEEEKEEIVIEMYADGLPVERIAKILKISVEKVLQIIENHVGK